MHNTNYETKVAVVIPCYKVSHHILGIIGSIGPEVQTIYVIDDCCPEKTGQMVLERNIDSRVKVLLHSANMGVGGAVMTGYQEAIKDQMTVIVKIDGDGQMDCSQIPKLVNPIKSGDADYTKGNRFYNLEKISAMPRVRLFGNACLSMMAKFSSGYWNLFDPTNGFTAIHADVAKLLPYKKISNRYFFETDILFRLNTLGAVVMDIPMDARYGDEVSNLKISRIFFEFLGKHIRNFVKRIFYNYYLRDMSLASIELPLGVLLFLFGTLFGLQHWYQSSISGQPTTAGTVMIVGLSLLMGLQLILAFLAYDIASIPKSTLHKNL